MYINNHNPKKITKRSVILNSFQDLIKATKQNPNRHCKKRSSLIKTTHTLRQFECFIRSMRIKCIENEHKQNTQRPSNPIPTQSEPAVSSIINKIR